MRIKHMLLEGFCEFDRGPKNLCCMEFDGQMGLHCIGCKNFSYIKAPNALVLVNNDSIVEKLEDFGAYKYGVEKENFEVWKEICRKKIDECLDEYEKYINASEKL